MKTSVELNEEKVKLAKKLSDASTLKELLDKALDAYIARARRLSMAEILGSDFFTDDLSKMRKPRGHSHR